MTEEINFEELIKNRAKLTEKDEYMHDFVNFPKYHNESWYFNMIGRPNNVFFITRLSIHMDKKKSRILLLLVVDGKVDTYYNVVQLNNMPENWEFDEKTQYYCIKPMDEWRITFEDQKFKLDITFKGRFPVFNSADAENPKDFLKKYGEELLQIAAQEHYEQPMIATGTLSFKKKGEIIKSRNIKGLGHRDHSWGIRKWVQIDGWNWVSAQFEDETINFIRSELLGKSPQSGVIFSKGKENTIIEKIEVTTETKDDGKTPISSIFILTDKEGKERILKSETIHSTYLPLPSRTGKTEIFEQVAIFICEGKEGDGISEYLISTRD